MKKFLQMVFDPDTPLSSASVDLLADYLRDGAKPRAAWRCGLEFEVFGYQAESLARIGAAEVQGVLRELAGSKSSLVFEDDTLVEVAEGSGARLTVEPGGQLEFSGSPERDLVDTEEAVKRYLQRLSEVARERKLIFLAIGFDPLRTAGEQPHFPKNRYRVMRPYLKRQGARALDMMHRTCAIQTNLDYGSSVKSAGSAEDADDLTRKFVVGNRLAPIITAIFANSPFEVGRPSGYKSTRAAVWLATDADRTSAPPADFNPKGFTLESFVEDALDVPMIFVRRAGRYLALLPGVTFRKFLISETPNAAMTAATTSTLRPVMGDWIDHLSTLFTDARLRQYIELRSADAGTIEMALAMQALGKGLMYDCATLDEASRLLPSLTRAEHLELQECVARDGLAARCAGVEVLSVAKEIVRLASDGLKRVAGEEVSYLDVLHNQVIEDEVCPADILLRNWHGSWHASISKVIEYVQIA